jgi:rfaE bifunctional protein nucleotidyltransferase chain/domain
VNFREKILNRESLPGWRKHLRSLGKRLVVTNGCFDLLHVGHVTYLESARNEGDALLVGLNSDASVQALKGPTRPINREQDRACVLAALESVSAVFIFPEVRATAFLDFVQPDIYVKGADYNIDTIPQEERRIVEGHRGRIVFLSFVPGVSTTELVKKMATPAPMT